MRVVDLINRKKRGASLSREELHFLIQGFTEGTIPDYQMSAFLMAVCWRGMTDREITDLTLEMEQSGDEMDLSAIPGIKVDKHSTGGIGDKTTLILGPLTASFGVPVAKMSGRGLGATGGTIDKLESIPGFCSELTEEQFLRQVREVGFADASQTRSLAPADKKLYALRDVTGTVDSLPLIASSIMSKKLASGADAIVLDVKWGSGAFMKTPEEAIRLAEIMMQIGKSAGKNMTALVTDMNEPLGKTVGNALEVEEAISFLKNPDEADPRLREVVFALADAMLTAGGKKVSKTEMREKCLSGEAVRKMRQFIRAQGGNPDVTEDFNLFPSAAYQERVTFDRTGIVSSCDAGEVGNVSMLLGAGRGRLTDEIDPAAGIRILHHVGDFVRKGETAAILYSSRSSVMKEASYRYRKAWTICEGREESRNPGKQPAVLKILH